ncbi:2-keto-4-pentenoate hydratase [Pseudoxanthomonas broegbernensis]|uniref:2-keto-4-pentenoate hydratase n=1 Tax=Pseudoxanthomonas broegbernensis TaxID=83619 RepID=A0A7V8K683_9GAMM|nr:fumarylacetoacetate hydrolase family protein [Pseudoxanthomonas broegbernensis]KAF1685105.1 2-keto-4-pentenoate hydratase [Pseudoxanthomonas broegbernensis]MBB6066232.1 2-keto-4-pentenoate hydratase [Pseudoxanthomonas broegbernensis]
MSASSFDVLAASGPVREAARLLGQAARTATACDPVKPLIETDGIDAAYTVQHLLTEEALAGGRRLVGRKVGLTSVAVQKQLGVDQPDYGMLFDDMAYGDGEEMPLSRLIQPKVEAEIAFVLERDLDAERPTLAHVLNAIGYALPAIEIVDSRVRDWKISILDTIADNASSGLYVLGGSPRKVDAFDLRLCGMSLEKAGEPVSLGCGAACLGNPLNAVVWLARTAARTGRPLRAGDTVLSGALGPMAAVRPGDVFEARISGLGRVAAVFSGE